ncbi:MAG: hypothetical protein ACM35G_01735, partial [Planctomycetaceae bacterium]
MSDDGGKDARQVGRDEMNLAEFPITLLTDHPSMGVKTLVFGGQYGRLTVSGSDDFGLPTALDADVIVGLIQLGVVARITLIEPRTYGNWDRQFAAIWA